MGHTFDGESVAVDSLEEVTLARLRENTVSLPREAAPPPPAWGWGLSKSLLSFPKGANAVYRGVYRGEDIQVRVYDDTYTVQLDHANPVEAPIRHLLLDVPLKLRLLLLAGGLLAALAVPAALARLL